MQMAGTIGGIFKLNPQVDDLPDEFSSKFNGVKHLVLGTVEKGGSGCICPESTMLKALMKHVIVRRDEVVIMDMEAGIEHLGRGTSASVDAMLVVVEPGQRSVQTARQIQKLAADLLQTFYSRADDILTVEDVQLGLIELADVDPDLQPGADHVQAENRPAPAQQQCRESKLTGDQPGARRAVEDEDAVAQELVDAAAMARDQGTDAPLIVLQHLHDVARRQFRGQAGEAAQVDEHHRDLATVRLERIIDLPRQDQVADARRHEALEAREAFDLGHLLGDALFQGRIRLAQAPLAQAARHHAGGDAFGAREQRRAACQLERSAADLHSFLQLRMYLDKGTADRPGGKRQPPHGVGKNDCRQTAVKERHLFDDEQ